MLGQIIGGILTALFCGSLTVLVLWGAWRNLDLPAFEALRKPSPAYFRNLVLVCRFNGPLMVLMSLGMTIFSPALLFDESIPWLALRIPGAVLGFLIGASWLYISWRWTRWGYRASLPAKAH